MKILSPDTFNEIKESHSGLYFFAAIFGIGVFFIMLLAFGLLKIIIELAIKHYYYVLGIIAAILFFKIKRRKKVEHPNRQI